MRQPQERVQDVGSEQQHVAAEHVAEGAESRTQFTGIGSLPPVAEDVFEDQPSASELAFDDARAGYEEDSERDASPFDLAIKSAAPKTATKAKPTFKTLAGTRVEKTSRSEAKLLNELRANPVRLSPEWLEKAQESLGVGDKTGAMNTETLRAMQKHAADTLQISSLDAATLLSATFLNSILAGNPFAVAAQDWEHNEEKDANAKTNADICAQEVGYASYKAYSKDFVTNVTFLDRPIGGDDRVHRFLHERLKVAEAFLIQHHGSKEEAVKKLPPITLSYDTEESARKSGKAHQHTMGLAIDINPSQNPYIYRGGSDAGKRYDLHFSIAAKLFGGAAVTSGNMNDWSRSQSTEELHGTIDTASNNFAKYLAFAKKPVDEIQEELEKKVEKDPEKAKVLAQKVSEFPAWFHGVSGQENTKELTNIDMSLLVALRDVAGLNWGGTEMGLVENGDFMHFDCRNTDFGGTISKKAGELAAADKRKRDAEAAKKKEQDTKK